jgi:hypothetical protein
MAVADDPIEARLKIVKEELDSGIEPDLSGATVAGILSFIPGIGPAVQSLLDGKARQNVERRWVHLFADLKAHLEEIRASIPDESYYSSEEFQTLLALAYEQLWTTHDREKLRMLATALANSGSTVFEADDKELMTRALRNLSPSDIKTLNHENLKGWRPLTSEIQYSADILGSLSRLAGSGLIIERYPKRNMSVDIQQSPSPTWLTFHAAMVRSIVLRLIVHCYKTPYFMNTSRSDLPSRSSRLE